MALAACIRRRIVVVQHGARGMARAAPTPTPPPSPPPTETATSPPTVLRTWGGQIIKRGKRPIGDLWHARLDYKREVLSLRSKYREEVARQNAEKKAKDDAERELKLQGREEKQIKRRQYSEITRLKHQKSREALRVILEEQRVRRAEYFKEMQAKHAEKKEKARLKIRQESCSWIEEKDLEMRILESMVEPIRLIGSSNTSKLESFETVSYNRSNRVKEDPLLRDSDDELLSAFTRKSPKVTGQDILASVSKATTKLQF